MRTTLVLCWAVASLAAIGPASAQQTQTITTTAAVNERAAASPRAKSKAVKRPPPVLARKPAPAAADVTPAGFTPDDLAKLHGPKQNWYLRANPLELGSFALLYPNGGLGKDGASISFTNDLLNHARSTTIHTLAAYALPIYEDPVPPSRGGPVKLTAIAAAPFVWLDGTLTDPRKPTERSSLQSGFDLQAEFAGGGLFSLQDFGLRPYWQTDFRGEGQIAGVQALWEPYKEQWHLGGRFDVAAPKLVGILWRVIGEFNGIHVDKPGLSDYAAHTNYAWLGGTLQVRAVLFENLATVPEWLCGRIVLNGSTNYFWDARSGKTVNDNEARVGYKLAPSPSSAQCTAAAAARSDGPQLQPELSFVYNNGTDKITLEKREKYTISVSLQF